jgi:ABC-type transport system involved in Fe-S cluster assembly fused permease/ATPase subunit
MTSTPRSLRGQALVEFALVLPLLILVMVGLFDLGRAVYADSTLSNAARAGSRVAIVNQNVSEIQAAAVTKAAALDLLPADVSVSFRSDPTDSSSTCTPMRIGCVAFVTVSYQYHPAVPIEGLVGPIVLTSTSSQRVERARP